MRTKQIESQIRVDQEARRAQEDWASIPVAFQCKNLKDSWLFLTLREESLGRGAEHRRGGGRPPFLRQGKEK